jgi:peptidyl-prolyl cis-trans isomerase D
MLETMRRLEKTWVAKLLLGILVLAFGVWGISGIAGSAFDTALSLTGWGPQDLAHVGGITIKGDEFTNSLQTQLRNLNAQSGQNLTLTMRARWVLTSKCWKTWSRKPLLPVPPLS